MIGATSADGFADRLIHVFTDYAVNRFVVSDLGGHAFGRDAETCRMASATSSRPSSSWPWPALARAGAVDCR